MGKCPLCGSPGDDLVFRFYCTNRECENFEPEKGEKQGDDGEILGPGEVFRFSEPEFLGGFPERKDIPIDLEFDQDGELKMLSEEIGFLKRRILEGLRMPRGFFDEPGYGSSFHGLVDDAPYPRFQLVADPVERGLFLTWIDRVPAVLSDFVEPILEGRIGEPMTESATLSTRDEIIRYLLDLRRRDELVWNRHRGRWELHFTE